MFLFLCVMREHTQRIHARKSSGGQIGVWRVRQRTDLRVRNTRRRRRLLTAAARAPPTARVIALWVSPGFKTRDEADGFELNELFKKYISK